MIGELLRPLEEIGGDRSAEILSTLGDLDGNLSASEPRVAVGAVYPPGREPSR